MQPIVHFEIPAENLDRAQRFYKETFGWEFMAMPEVDYVMVQTTPTDPETQQPTTPGAINGGMHQRNPQSKSPTIVVDVPELEPYLEKLKKNGGKLLGEVIPVGEFGRVAYFEDPEGNRIGLWQTLRKG